jgi:plasmid maintenance system antidote protein VapI
VNNFSSRPPAYSTSFYLEWRSAKVELNQTLQRRLWSSGLRLEFDMVLFTGAFNEKFEQLRKQFSADELFKLLGNDPKKMDAATEALRVQAEKIQRLVATGIGGAASASIDMILNAFSMSPVFGTTILVWRMFQNMLMIMGASLSVQAASNSGATTLATIANPKLAAEPPTPKIVNKFLFDNQSQLIVFLSLQNPIVSHTLYNSKPQTNHLYKCRVLT